MSNIWCAMPVLIYISVQTNQSFSPKVFVYIYIYTLPEKSPAPFPDFVVIGPLLETRLFLNGRRIWWRNRTSKQISGGFRACLGHEKIYKQFWKIRSGRLPTLGTKNGHSKIESLRAHCDPSAASCAKTLLILKKARLILFKMSGGFVYLRFFGR